MENKLLALIQLSKVLNHNILLNRMMLMTCVRSTIGGLEVSARASNAETAESLINYMRMNTLGRRPAEEESVKFAEPKSGIRTIFGLKENAKAGGA